MDRNVRPSSLEGMTHARQHDGRPSSPATVFMMVSIFVIVLFGSTVSFPWLAWDDRIHVTENPGLNPVSLQSLFDFWTKPYEKLYIPVSYCFFAGETIVGRALFGGDATAPPPAGVFHVCSLALHAIATMLVFRLIGRLGVTDNYARMAGALLFVSHPLQVESVAWISEQRGLLAAVFSLSAICLSPADLRSPAPKSSWHMPLALLCFLLATLSKPQAIVLPAIILVLDDRTWVAHPSRTAIRFLPWMAVAVGALLATVAAQPSAGMLEKPPLWLRPVVAGDAIWHYATAVVAPLGLTIDYGRIPHVVLSDSWSFIRAGVIAIGVLGITALPATRLWRVPLALSAMPLLPVLGFMPFVFQGISTVADRYAYLAMAGPACGLSMWLSTPGKARPARRGVVLALLGAGALITCRQVQTWRDSTTVFTHAIRMNPRSFIGYRGLGGEFLEQHRYIEAIAQFDAALALEANLRAPSKTFYPRARARHRLGDLAHAAQDYRQCLALDPENARAHNDFGILLAQSNALPDAAAHFRKALTVNPGFVEAQHNLRSALSAIMRQDNDRPRDTGAGESEAFRRDTCE